MLLIARLGWSCLLFVPVWIRIVVQSSAECQRWWYTTDVERTLCHSFDSLERPRMPKIYFQVASQDTWGRHRTEGYTYIDVPNFPGETIKFDFCVRMDFRRILWRASRLLATPWWFHLRWTASILYRWFCRTGWFGVCGHTWAVSKWTGEMRDRSMFVCIDVLLGQRSV